MLSFTFRYGSSWRRLIALVIDLAVVFAVGALMFDPVSIVLGHDALKEATMHSPFSVIVLRDYGVWSVATIIIAWLYFAGMESSLGQATLGKRAMGLIVVTSSEGRLSFRRSSLRFWIKALSLFTVFAGYVLALFDSKSRMLHDRVAGSLVLEARPEAILGVEK